MKFSALSLGLMAGITMTAPTPTINEVAEVANRASVTDVSFYLVLSYFSSDKSRPRSAMLPRMAGPLEEQVELPPQSQPTHNSQLPFPAPMQRSSLSVDQSLKLQTKSRSAATQAFSELHPMLSLPVSVSLLRV